MWVVETLPDAEPRPTLDFKSNLLATNITTIEFLPEGQSVRIKATVQVTSFVGHGMIENTKAGHTGSLINMARYLEQPKP